MVTDMDTSKGYAVNFRGMTFTPDGRIDTPNEGTPREIDVDARNRETERQELAHIATGPDRLFLYVRQEPDARFPHATCPGVITTWLGTVVSKYAHFGPKRYIGFGHNSYRRAVTAKIGNSIYTGWYIESSGDYCRLKKSKRQSKGEGKG